MNGMQAPVIGLLAGALCLAGSLPAADVVLVDGRVVSGEVLGTVDGQLRIRIPLGLSIGIVAFPAEQVARIDPAGGVEAGHQLEVLRGYESVSATAAIGDWERLRDRAQVAGLGALARRCAEQVVRMDRHREDMARLAGLVRFRGVWMRPSEVAAAQGKVLFEGQWVSWSERSEKEAERARIAAEQAEAARLLFKRQEQLAQAQRNAAAIQDYVNRTQVQPYGQLHTTETGTLWWNLNRSAPIIWRSTPYPGQVQPTLRLSGTHTWGNGSITWNFNW